MKRTDTYIILIDNAPESLDELNEISINSNADLNLLEANKILHTFEKEIRKAIPALTDDHSIEILTVMDFIKHVNNNPVYSYDEAYIALKINH